MKLSLNLPAAALVVLSAAAMPAFAIDVYVVQLTGANESPANASLGFGAGLVTIDTVLGTMRVQTTFGGLSGNVSASHIHCCTGTAGTGNAGVATPTPTFPGFPLGNTYGSYDQTFNMTLATSWNAAYITANGGTPASAFSAFTTGVAAGKAYLNIHSSAFPGGEIRGFLVPAVAAVPEPSTYALMLAGMAAVGWVARKRQQA